MQHSNLMVFDIETIPDKDHHEGDKFPIHQANEKMDEAIVKRFYKLYGKEMPEGIMPMTIDKSVPAAFTRSVGTVLLTCTG